MSEERLLPDDILLMDDYFMGRPQLIGTYVLSGERPALVDPGPASTLPRLEAGLAAHGLTFQDIQTVLLTHIHLDHAGGTGKLVARYPHLHVYVHQRGAPHLVNPERLIRSAGRLYGAAMDQLWGEILPVPAENVTALAGGESIVAGDRVFYAYDTPGHAYHHLIFADQADGLVFVGDLLGVRMPGTGYIRPATPPPEVDLEAWQASLDALVALQPRLLLLPHFGPLDMPAEQIETFRKRLLTWAEFVRQGLELDLSEAEQIARLQALAMEELGPELASLAEDYQQVISIELSWHGLARYWRKRAEREQSQ